MNEMCLQIKDLSHSYDNEMFSIKTLNLEIRKGERVSIQGPSGCGKSTLLRLIAGLEKPSKGKIFVSGKEVANEVFSMPPEKRNVGLVVQEKALFPHLSVLENICFGIRKLPNKNQIAKEPLGLFKIDRLKEKYPHQISGGEQQRVAFARSLAPSPKFLMLDEAFSALDPDLKKTLYEEVTDIFSSKNSTVLLVTHDSEEATLLTDRQLIMKNGELV